MTGMSKRVGAASIWIALTRAAVNSFGLISTIVLARLLVPSDFGLVATGTAIYAVMLAVTDMSMAQALINHANPTREHMHTAWTLGALRGAIIGALLALSGPFVASSFGDPRLVTVMNIFGIGMFLSGLENPRPTLLKKDLIFWQDFILNLSSRFAALVVSVVIAYFYRSYWALLLGTISGQLVSLIISYMILPFLPRPSLRHAREMMGFSIWLTLGNAVDNVNWRLDTLLVGKFLGTRYLGLYSVGNTLSSFLTRETTQPIAQALFPAFTHVRDDASRLRTAYQRAQTLMTAIALPMGFGMAIIGDLLVLLLLGDKWLPALIVVQVIAIVSALQSMERPARSLAMALGATRLLFWRSVQMMVFRVPMIVLGIYLGGFEGLVYARMISGFTSIFANFWIVRQLTGLSMLEQFMANCRPVGAVLVMSAAVLLLKGQLPAGHSQIDLILEVTACVVTGGVVYLGTLFGVWLALGRPPGSEREIIDLSTAGIGKIRSHFRSAKGVAA